MRHHFDRLSVAVKVIGTVLLIAGAIKLSTGLGANSAAHDGTLFDFYGTHYPPLRYLIPLIEIALGTSLVINRACSVSLPAAIVLFSLFSGIVAVELVQPLPRECGCISPALFGGLSPRAVLSISFGVDVVSVIVLLRLFLRIGKNPTQRSVFSAPIGDQPALPVVRPDAIP